MQSAIDLFAGQKMTKPDWATKTRSVTGSRKLWFAIGALVLIAGLGLNWGWLMAVGVAPLLIAFLPCAVMCGLSLCMMNGTKGCKGGNTEQAPAALDANRR